MTYRVLAIGAWDRSGSTVLAQTLGSVPGIISVGELNNLWQRGVVEDRTCSCGARFSTCAFWSTVMDKAFSGEEGAELLARVVDASARMSNLKMIIDRLLPSRASVVVRDTYAQGLSRLYTAIAATSGADVIVDSAKNTWHIEIGRELLGRRQILLHLIRDPRGVAYSHRKVMAYDNQDSQHMMSRRGVAFTTAGWTFRNALFSWLWRGDDSCIPLLYEDFARRPSEVTALLLNRLGMPVAVASSSQVMEVLPEHNVSGNPVRFKSGPIEIRVDEEWKHGLNRTTATMIGFVTWPLRAVYRRRAHDWIREAGGIG